MSEWPAPTTGRLVRISLRDVPIEIRRREGGKLKDALSRQSGGDVFAYIQVIEEVAELERAIEQPNGDTQEISEAAVLRVLGSLPW